MQTADVVIVGGAAVGSAIAYFLGRDGFPGRIVVVEKDPSYQWCATTRSVASIRQQFSTPECIRLSQFGWQYFRNIQDEHGPEAEVSLVERGYLIMAGPAGRGALESNIALQQGLGADVVLLEPDEIRRRFSWLSTDGLTGAGWGRSGEGWVDPHAHLMLLRKGAIARGANYLADEVVGIDQQGDRVAGVRLKSGGTIASPLIVCAAGWHARRIVEMAGATLPVSPRKRHVFVIEAPEPLPGAGLTIDPSGVYLRPEGRTFLTGTAPPESEDPEATDFDTDHDLFERSVWPALAARIPMLERLRLVNAWTCHYDLCTLDQNAILGPHPAVRGLLLACGFSGHGLQHSPGVGRAIAELIVHGNYRSIDLTRLGFERIAANAPLRELNVY